MSRDDQRLGPNEWTDVDSVTVIPAVPDDSIRRRATETSCPIRKLVLKRQSFTSARRGRFLDAAGEHSAEGVEDWPAEASPAACQC